MSALSLELLALLFYAPAVVLLHELGHALFARRGGFRVTSFGIGLGRPLWTHELSGGVLLHIDRWVLAGGACAAIPNRPPTVRRAWFHAGGLILQGVLALVLLALPDSWLGERIARFNLLVALTNALPWKVQGAASDGWHLLDTWFGVGRAGEVHAQRDQLERLWGREATVGSRVGKVYAEVCLAWIDVLAHRPEDAAHLFREDPPETTVDPWVDALYHYVHAEWHRLEGRPLAALGTIRETRAALADRLADEAAAMLTVAEAAALLDLDAPEHAERALARVADVGGPIGRQAAAIHLAATLAQVDEDPRQDAELELATWRVVRRVHEPWLDPAEVVVVLGEVAERFDRTHRREAARGARNTARELARRLLATASPEDRLPLMRRMGAIAGYRPGALLGREEQA